MHPRRCLHHGIGFATFQNPGMEAISGIHVHWYGDIGGLSCAGWLAHVWLSPDAEANWLVLASFTGFPVHPGCHALRREFLLPVFKATD